jgi:hypothetical protein
MKQIAMCVLIGCAAWFSLAYAAPRCMAGDQFWCGRVLALAPQ